MGATRASYGLGHVPGRGRTPTEIRDDVADVGLELEGGDWQVFVLEPPTKQAPHDVHQSLEPWP
jgi:hypothetical protein